MNTKTLTINISIYIAALCLPGPTIAQNLEVEGKAKITQMDKDNTADSVVVRLADGTLAIRDVSSLSAASTSDYSTVVNPATGKVWLDRNLGASQVATSPTDTASYGDLYQWGRAADGHQLRNSATQNTQATTWLADEGSNVWDGKFITESIDWLSTGETDLWSGTAAENNPCPSGFRLPTNAEWNQERLTWSSSDAAGAFASPLKLPLAGGRNDSNGSLIDVGATGGYWSSTVSGAIARLLFFDSSVANMNANFRGFGRSVRCLKD